MADLVVKGEFGAERQYIDNWHRGIKYNAMYHSVDTIGIFSSQHFKDASYGVLYLDFYFLCWEGLRIHIK